MIGMLLDSVIPSSHEMARHVDMNLLKGLVKGLRPIFDPTLIKDSDRLLASNQAVENLDSFFECRVCSHVVRQPISCSQCEKAFC